MIPILALGATLAPLLAAAQSPAGLPASTRRAQVEQGLLPAVVVVGQRVAATGLAEQMQALHVPGVAVAVIAGGRVDWMAGYGRTGGPHEAAVTPATLFQAGSVSKPVAAMAALALAQQGVVSLDVPVNRLLTSWQLPENAFTRQRAVTLRALLSHTAGTTVHGFAGYAAGEPVPTSVQVLEGSGNSEAVRVDAPVGGQYRYSGGGYTVMQQALVDASAQTFPALTYKAVLAPLGMQASTYEQPLPASRLQTVAWPFDEHGTPVSGGPHTYPEMAAAGLWTSAEDLARFALEFCAAARGQGRVLTASSLQSMLTPVRGDWGLGVKVGGSPARRYAYHDGSNEGYKATWAVYPSTCDGAVVLTNGEQGYALGQSLLRAIASAYDWPDFKPVSRRAQALPATSLPAFAGTYVIAGLGDFQVRLEQGRLWLEIRPGQVYPLIAASPRRFFITELDYVLEFDQAAHPHQGVLQADGTRLAFTRTPGP